MRPYRYCQVSSNCVIARTKWMYKIDIDGNGEICIGHYFCMGTTHIETYFHWHSVELFVAKDWPVLVQYMAVNRKMRISSRIAILFVLFKLPIPFNTRQ